MTVIAHRCRDHLHQVITDLVRENQVVEIECINISGMLRDHGLARAALAVAWWKPQSLPEYECTWCGRDLTARSILAAGVAER